VTSTGRRGAGPPQTANTANAAADAIFAELEEVKKKREKAELAQALEESRRMVRRTLRETDVDVELPLPTEAEDYVLPRPLRVGDRVILKNIGKPLDKKRDDMYKWTDVTFAAKSVYDAIGGKKPQKEMQPADSRAERSTENITRHLEAHIAAHPETTFKIYMPPYSVGYWYLMTREGLSEQQYRSRARVCEYLLKYPNVEIYDFSSRIEWITDLDEYFDYSHHSSTMSDSIMRAMAAGENRVNSVEDMWEGSDKIREAVESFAAAYER